MGGVRDEVGVVTDRDAEILGKDEVFNKVTHSSLVVSPLGLLPEVGGVTVT